MAALPKFISLPDAAKKIHASIEDLRPLIEKGKIKAATINGEIFVDTLTLPEQILKKEELPEYKKFKKLRGVAISISEAARKYGIPHPTISRWRKKGLLKLVREEPNYIFVDEQDVAFCAYFHRQYDNPGGQWIFDENGVPRSKISMKVRSRAVA
jgi:hypothetical protein